MFRATVCTFIVVLLLLCFVSSKGSAKDPASVRNYRGLDGVYEFVSESTVLTKPKKIAYKRMSPEWGGAWQFQAGYYSRTLMKKRREAFFDLKKQKDLGFESFAGPYEVEGGTIQLMQTYALNPFQVGRSALMTYRIEGDTLILTEKLLPYMEDLREGTVTTALRRVK